MSTEIAIRPPVVPGAQADVLHLVHPDTGEMLSLADASDADLVAWRRAVMAWEDNARQAKRLCDSEVIRRMDIRNEHTLHVGDGLGSASAPASTEKDDYDGEGIWKDLTHLSMAGAVDLAQEAIDAAVKRETVYKPQVQKLKGLLKRGGTIAEVIKAHTSQTPVDRRVTLKGGA